MSRHETNAGAPCTALLLFLGHPEKRGRHAARPPPKSREETPKEGSDAAAIARCGTGHRGLAAISADAKSIELIGWAERYAASGAEHRN